MAHQDIADDTFEDLNREAVTHESSALDQPVSAWLRLNWETIAWAILIILAFVTRFYDLGVRAMSHDESLHALYSFYLYDAGNYDHNPMMHGPLLFHINALFYTLFGATDATARFGPALAGVGLVGMAYPLRRYIGRTGALMAGILILLSPSLLFHSRYIRNDIYIALFTVIWSYGAFRYLDTGKLRWVTIMVLGMAFGFVTKENHFMGGALLGAFFAGLAMWQVMERLLFAVAAPLILAGSVAYYFHAVAQDTYSLIAVGAGVASALFLFIWYVRGAPWRALRRNPSFDLAVIMLTLVLPFTAPFGHLALGWDAMAFGTRTDLLRSVALVAAVTAIAALIAFFWFGMRRKLEDEPTITFGDWAKLMGLFWVIQILFFTTFFTNTKDGLATGIVGSLGYWLAQQEVARGGQPGYYYLMIGALYEFLPMILSGVGVVVVGYQLFRNQSWDPASDLPAEIEALAPVQVVGEDETEESSDLELLTTDNDALTAELDIGTDIETESDLEAPLEAAADPELVVDESVVTAPVIDVAEHLRRNRVYFAIFSIWWIIGSWAAYTVAGEKMPWLMTHMALPMSIFGGWYLGRLLQRIDWARARSSHAIWLIGVTPAALFLLAILIGNPPSFGRTEAALAGMTQWLLAFALTAGVFYLAWRWIRAIGAWMAARLLALGLVAILLLLTVRFTYMLTYVNFDMATEYMVYAHATPDVKRMLNELDMISERTVGERNIFVSYDDDTSWPLSWYMRDYPNSMFYGGTPSTDSMAAPVIIVGSGGHEGSNYDKVHPYVLRDYVKRPYRLVWWPDQSYFNLTWERVQETLSDPQKRENLWDIAFYRRYPDDSDPTQIRDLTLWPNRHEFEMWVRRDLVDDIWDLNVAPLTGGAITAEAQLRDVEIDFPATAIYNDLYDDLPLNAPRAVAVGQDGMRYIADTGNHRAVVLQPDGTMVRTIGSFCNLAEGESSGCVDPDGDGPLMLGDGQFNEPWGVAADADGNVYVADTWNGRIQVFDADGEFAAKWGGFNMISEWPSDAYALFGPRGIAIDLDGNLLVADTGNKRIIKYAPTGAEIQQIGGGGVVASRFEEPTDVTVDPTDGSVFVADAWNRRIQKFTPELEFIAEWPVPSWESQDRFHKPYLAVDLDGRIFASDPAMYRIFIFDREGEITASFGNFGTENNRFAMPNGVATDPRNGELLGADADNARVMLFQP